MTVTQVISEALYERLAREHSSEAPPPDLPVDPEGRLLPGVDLADNAALRDLMDRS